MEEKLMWLAVIIYMAIVVSSIFKFGKQSPKKVIIAFVMPIILVVFLIDFSQFIWKNDLQKISLSEKAKNFIKLLVFEMECLPIIHTMVISTIKKITEEKVGLSIIIKAPSNKISIQKLRKELNPYIETNFV